MTFAPSPPCPAPLRVVAPPVTQQDCASSPRWTASPLNPVVFVNPVTGVNPEGQALWRHPTSMHQSPHLPPPTPESSRSTPTKGGSVLRLDPLLLHLMEVGGSDLHMAAGSQPRVRVRGEMGAISNTDVLTPDSIQSAIYGILNAKQQKAFEENLELDFAYSIPGEGRFRANIFRHAAASAPSSAPSRGRSSPSSP